MELKIYSPTEDGFVQAIEWNHEEIKKEIAEKVKHYTNLVYTEDQIKIAKADRAKLIKFVAALETKRKEVKKQCLAPYEDFEQKMKEIVAIVNEPILMIDSQVKGYEEQQKAEKLEEIKAYWAEILQDNKIPAGITFEHLFDEKWLNASVRMSAVQKEFDAKLDTITKDLATLSNLPEFGFEATEEYKRSLDLNRAIAEGQRLSEIQKRKKEAAAKFERAIMHPAPNVELPDEAPTEQPQKQWVSFKALLSTDDALALKQFFNSRNIEFKAIN